MTPVLSKTEAGFTTQDMTDFVFWVVKEGYLVDAQLDGEVYWFKWIDNDSFGKAKFPCGTTKDLLAKFIIAK